MSVTTQENLKLETLQMFQHYQKSANTQLRNQIMELNFGLVRKEANHWANQCRESYEDLLQVGCLGLIRAIERFDVGKGYSFSAFAVPYIRGEIQHYLRDKGYIVKIPRRWLELGQKAAAIRMEWQTKYHRPPRPQEIAQALNLSLQEWLDIELAWENRDPMSLDAALVHDEEGQTSLGDTIPCPRYRSFQLSQEDQIRLHQALSKLEERTRQVLEFVFLKDLTQGETAKRLGISVVTVSRQVKKGLTTLRQSMKNEF